MRMLIIGLEEKEELRRIKEYAETHIMDMDYLLDNLNKEEQPVGYYNDYKCKIPDGFTVVYSIEDQPAGRIRHLSVSVPGKGKVPSIAAMQMIMEELGYENKVADCQVYMEDIGEGHQAVNILEIIGKKMQKKVGKYQNK